MTSPRAVEFYSNVLGIRLSDRSDDNVAFMHGVHGSDHHLIAFGRSDGPGFHHCSWDVGSVEDVGLGATQMGATAYSPAGASAGTFSAPTISTTCAIRGAATRNIRPTSTTCPRASIGRPPIIPAKIRSISGARTCPRISFATTKPKIKRAERARGSGGEEQDASAGRRRRAGRARARDRARPARHRGDRRRAALAHRRAAAREDHQCAHHAAHAALGPRRRAARRSPAALRLPDRHRVLDDAVRPHARRHRERLCRRKAPRSAFPEPAQWVPQYTVEKILHERIAKLPSVHAARGHGARGRVAIVRPA